ncbi:MAG: protein-methionine-sulfoxide reductase catalytic subunit MsrP, partial [Thioalkalispiraceae bacterium]
MLIKRPSDIPSSEITDKETYLNRRRFMQSMAGLALMPTLLSKAQAGYGNKPLSFNKLQQYRIDEELTPYKDITNYNNFYEFGTDKYSPAREAQQLTVDPWSITIAGHVEKPGSYALEDIIKPHPLEERIYRLRCVERWSMVIPWIGFPLADLIKRFQPTSRAKFVKFTTLERKSEMPGVRRRVLDWPYVEGLRLDE